MNQELGTSIGGAVGGAAKAVTNNLVTQLFFGSFNKDYKVEDQKRMRYIQSKYAAAYGNKAAEDPETVIQRIDPNSRLRMTNDGRKPSNPFQHERAFEESLHFVFHPLPGHEGRFTASHALACIDRITEYQSQRQKRRWIPGLPKSGRANDCINLFLDEIKTWTRVQKPGRANDYINMFLDEIKTWMRQQMTLNVVCAEELERREVYLTKLKHDNYYWCFPLETSHEYTIHDTIDFVHKRVLDALEMVKREERNKSLQQLFKELNDHTTNAFEFGKNFLAYLLTTSKKAGADLTTSQKFDGESYETGKLHRLLERNTDPVMKMYVADIRATEKRIEGSGGGGGQGMLALTSTSSSPSSPTTTRSSTPMLVDPGELEGHYHIDPPKVEDGGLMKGVTYILSLTDPKGTTWTIRKKFADFEALAKEMIVIKTATTTISSPSPATTPQQQLLENSSSTSSSLNTSSASSGRVSSSTDLATELRQTFPSPGKFTGVAFKPTQAKQEERRQGLQRYLLKLLEGVASLTEKARKSLCEFLDVKSIFDPPLAMVHPETIPNRFVDLKFKFKEMVLSGEKATAAVDRRRESGDERMMLQLLRQTWGVEPTIKILEGHALLQRMATLLGLTLEINHFFVSMFGNTLAFSKLPLRDLLLTLKDVMANFLVLASDLFKYACQLNAEQKYNWHKNLQVTEDKLNMVRNHVEKALAVITKIDTDHLDYEAQLKRLQDVTQRFTPLMSRLDYSLPQIQAELGLSSRTEMLTIGPDRRAALLPSTISSQGGGGGEQTMNMNMKSSVEIIDVTDEEKETTSMSGRPLLLPPLSSSSSSSSSSHPSAAGNLMVVVVSSSSSKDSTSINAAVSETSRAAVLPPLSSSNAPPPRIEEVEDLPLSTSSPTPFKPPPIASYQPAAAPSRPSAEAEGREGRDNDRSNQQALLHPNSASSRAVVAKCSDSKICTIS